MCSRYREATLAEGRKLEHVSWLAKVDVIHCFQGRLRGFQSIYSMKLTEETCHPSKKTCPTMKSFFHRRYVNMCASKREGGKITAACGRLWAGKIRLWRCSHGPTHSKVQQRLDRMIWLKHCGTRDDSLEDGSTSGTRTDESESTRLWTKLRRRHS